MREASAASARVRVPREPDCSALCSDGDAYGSTAVVTRAELFVRSRSLSAGDKEDTVAMLVIRPGAVGLAKIKIVISSPPSIRPWRRHTTTLRTTTLQDVPGSFPGSAHHP